MSLYKELECRPCKVFLSRYELKDGKCPVCLNDEHVYLNEDKSEDARYDLWKFFEQEHDLILLEGQLDDIIQAVEKYLQKVND
jgi:hypothetical protein